MCQPTTTSGKAVPEYVQGSLAVVPPSTSTFGITFTVTAPQQTGKQQTKAKKLIIHVILFMQTYLIHLNIIKRLFYFCNSIH